MAECSGLNDITRNRTHLFLFICQPCFALRCLNVSLMQMEKAMAPHSSTLAWKIPWKEEPGRLQSMGSLKVRHDWATSLSLFTFMHWRRKWQPTPVLAWRIPGTGEPGGLPSLGSHRVGHDWSNLAAAAAVLCLYFWVLCYCYLHGNLPPLLYSKSLGVRIPGPGCFHHSTSLRICSVLILF